MPILLLLLPAAYILEIASSPRGSTVPESLLFCNMHKFLTRPHSHVFVLLCSTFLGCSLFPLKAQQQASISVDASQRLGPVNRLVLGQNIEAGDDAYIFSSNTTDMNLIRTGDGFWNPAANAPDSSVAEQSKAVGMSMLRYPGGCLAHNYDWRKTVGPGAKKNGWLFGLDEYMSLCRVLGADPMITVSDYVLPADQMPTNAAGLVEYLNSPADAAHPWAMKRSAWGHPEPYHVRWFELGNESIHGNHRVLPHRQFSPEQYASYANATAAAMRKVDPSIKIGIVTVPGPGDDVESEWNRSVVHLAGQSADFVVIHLYAPQVKGAVASDDLLMQATMAVGDQSERAFARYHQMITRENGHDLPLAVTEYNGQLEDSVKPYRFTLGEALMCADLLRIVLNPSLKIATANYWQFLNGYFGMLRTTPGSATGKPEREEPALPLFQLWGQHFGAQLVRDDVLAPHAEFSGIGSVLPAKGTTGVDRRKLGNIALDPYLQLQRLTGPLVSVDRQGSDFVLHLHAIRADTYPLLARIPVPNHDPGNPIEFEVNFDASFVPNRGTDTPQLGIGLGDSAGWNSTHSGIGLDGIQTDTRHFEGTYRPLSSTQSIDLTARIQTQAKNVDGALRISNLSIVAYSSGHHPAYALLTSTASISNDGSTLYLVVFNKSADSAIPGNIHIQGFSAQKAAFWEVNGPQLQSTEGVRETASGSPVPLSGSTSATHVFPAHSMTVIQFAASRSQAP
jgi:alpha-L-arabinofuranosidase